MSKKKGLASVVPHSGICLVVIYFIMMTYISGNAQNLLNGPESVVYDSVYDRYLVSNMNFPYYITAIDDDGSYSVFNSDLEWPHGMTIKDDILYVTSNVGSQGGIVGLDLSTGERVFEFLSPAWFNAIYSNLTCDTSGNIYFGVFNSIYRLNFDEGISYFLHSDFNIPNGIHFDRRNNRVLIPCEVFGTELYAINANDYTLSTIPVDYGRYSCITEDQMHNIYISAFWEGDIFRFDSSLSNRELISTGHNGPEAIYFNKLHSTLVVPNLLENRIDFIPLNIDLWCSPGVTVGWAPFEVAFEGGSVFDIESWIWDFGDGHGSYLSSPTHVFESPGLFDITLRAVTTAGDTLTRVYPRHIFSLADSLWTDDFVYSKENDLEAIVWAKTSVPLGEIQIPIQYSGELDLVYDSFSTVGCFTDGFNGKIIIDNDPTAKRATFSLKPREAGSPLYAAPAEGSVIKLYFHAVDAVRNQQAALSLDGYNPEYLPQFIANGVDFNPLVRNGSLTYSFICGDSNGDDGVNIGDVVFLVNLIFHNGPAPEPRGAGDVNCDDNINIGDAVYLGNVIFRPGAVPPCAGCY